MPVDPTGETPADDLDIIYGDPAVRDRIREYLGGATPTATYVARCDGYLPQAIEKMQVSELEAALESPTDLARSLEDTKDLIVHLDIEYVNFDFPPAAFLDPWRAFQLQEPVVTVIEEELARFGIRPLHLLTGQGHHFVWCVPWGTSTADRFSGEVFSPSWNEGCCIREAAFGGLGLVMEYLAQEVKRKAAVFSELPVEITAVQPGKIGERQREIVSVDISEYGDPLPERIIRMPFTHYSKPWQTGIVDRFGLRDEVPRFVTLPLHEIDVRQAIKLRQDAQDVIAMARRTTVRIPRQAEGTDRLIDAYLESRLHKFHLEYYSQPQAVSHSVPADAFPPCIRNILTFPNDLLLKPAGIQLVTRFLLAKGWHPRHISGEVRERFENPGYNWMEGYWDVYNPAMRADFYVRLFAGLLATGVDQAIDFNCVSTQEKELCPYTGCEENLADFREHLIARHS